MEVIAATKNPGEPLGPPPPTIDLAARMSRRSGTFPATGLATLTRRQLGPTNVAPANAANQTETLPPRLDYQLAGRPYCGQPPYQLQIESDAVTSRTVGNRYGAQTSRGNR